MCGVSRKTKARIRLEAHHIVPKACDLSKIFDVKNGTLLCKKCHIAIHKTIKIRRNQYNYSLIELAELVQSLHFTKYKYKKRNGTRRRRRRK